MQQSSWCRRLQQTTVVWNSIYRRGLPTVFRQVCIISWLCFKCYFDCVLCICERTNVLNLTEITLSLRTIGMVRPQMSWEKYATHLTSRARRRIHTHNSSLHQAFENWSKLLSPSDAQARRVTFVFGTLLKRPENKGCSINWTTHEISVFQGSSVKSQNKVFSINWAT